MKEGGAGLVDASEFLLPSFVPSAETGWRVREVFEEKWLERGVRKEAIPRGRLGTWAGVLDSVGFSLSCFLRLEGGGGMTKAETSDVGGRRQANARALTVLTWARRGEG